MAEQSQSAIAKITWRVMPLAMLGFFFAYLDRTNIAMAGLTMPADLGMTPAGFGFAAGTFFFGYVLFEIPSNYALQKFGARVWLARIMVTWGVFAMLTAVAWDTTSLSVCRFLLGLAEAGFVPGIIFYFTGWFPRAYRTRMIGLFLAANPLSTLVGNPLSGVILRLNGWFGLHGWQWLFVLEGIPAILLGIAIYFLLPGDVASATWLSEPERQWVTATLRQEQDDATVEQVGNLGKALLNLNVWLMIVIYLGIIIGLYGVSLWLPQIIKAFGLGNTTVGLLAAIPSLGACIAMIAWTRHSDHTGERAWHTALACAAGFVGLVVAAYAGSPAVSLAALTLALAGILAGMAVFWSLPTSILAGSGSAAVIALINTIGSLGGVVGPTIMGFSRGATGDYRLGLVVLASALIVSAAVAIRFRKYAAPAAAGIGVR